MPENFQSEFGWPKRHLKRSPAMLRVRKSNICFSSQTVEWSTPLELFQYLDAEFHFTLDPCSTHQNAKCTRHFTRAEDGLALDWSNETVFMNPPYGREISRWIEKAFESARKGATVVCLIPARTDTKWWHAFVVHGEIRLLKGRVKFGGSKAGAPFPTAVVIFKGGLSVAKAPRPEITWPIYHKILPTCAYES